MSHKLNTGDLILDYSEPNVENVGYIFDINIDEEYKRSSPHRTLYGVYWLQPNPGPGDYYNLTDFNRWIERGVWKILQVKNE